MTSSAATLEPSPPPVEVAVVESVAPEPLVRLVDGGKAPARMAIAGPYEPREGDRVLVARGLDELYVVGVLHSADEATVRAPDGATATAHADGLDVRRPDGSVLFRYREGEVLLVADGDLTLGAPAGRLRIEGQDVELAAARDVVQTAGRSLRADVAGEERLSIAPDRTTLRGEKVAVEADEAQVVVRRASVVARQIATTASAMATSVEKWELTAERLVETTRDTFREATSLLQVTAGRVRQRVEGTFSLKSKRTKIRSDKATSIDGEKVLLG